MWETVEGKPRLQVHLGNRSNHEVWVPQEKDPGYRVDQGTHTTTIWYGYFDEIYGPYKPTYIVPPMKSLIASGEMKWEINDSALVEKIASPDFRTFIRVRLALTPIKESTVRGHQPLDAYLRQSCVVESAEIRHKI